jgi:hypothetical protein
MEGGAGWLPTSPESGENPNQATRCRPPLFAISRGMAALQFAAGPQLGVMKKPCRRRRRTSQSRHLHLLAHLMQKQYIDGGRHCH